MSISDHTAARAWQSFVRAKAQVRRAVHRELRERGLTGSQLEFMRVLADSGSEGVKLHEVSQKLFVTSGNVTGLIDRLEEAGYLARMAHPEDRRITLAMLTPAGRELFEEIHPTYVARIARVMSALTLAEQVTLAELLERIADRAASIDE